MKKTAVQFGAGNIGRGFIAQLFCESGLDVVFVDVDVELLQELNRRHEYTIHIVGAGAADVPITGICGIDGRDTNAVAQVVAESDIVCTAVGAGALPHIAPNLAAGLALRHHKRGGPLNILICENLHDANERLRSLVAQSLPEVERDEILANTGFVQAVVSRMVPLQSEIGNRKSELRVEEYKRLPVDGRAIVGTMPHIAGVEPVDNFIAHVERKLYTHNCAHATIGYLGWRCRFQFGYEALEDRGIHEQVGAVMGETGQALIRRHGFDPDEHAAHVADLMRRFQNRELGDTCFRLARDPIRKLAPDDRLVGAARLCESQAVGTAAVAEVIGWALRFDAIDDPGAIELQRRIRSDSIETVLQQVCGIAPGEPLGRAVLSAYSRS